MPLPDRFIVASQFRGDAKRLWRTHKTLTRVGARTSEAGTRITEILRTVTNADVGGSGRGSARVPMAGRFTCDLPTTGLAGCFGFVPFNLRVAHPASVEEVRCRRTPIRAMAVC